MVACHTLGPEQVVWLVPVLCRARVERAVEAHVLPTLAQELRSELAVLATADYSGHSLLQMKKQVCGGLGMV